MDIVKSGNMKDQAVQLAQDELSAPKINSVTSENAYANPAFSIEDTSCDCCKTDSFEELSQNFPDNISDAVFDVSRTHLVNFSVRSNYELSSRRPSVAMMTALRAARLKSRRRSSHDLLVSCTDVTPGALNVWSELPDQVKFDPSLATFRERFERQTGQKLNSTKTTPNQSAASLYRPLPTSVSGVRLEEGGKDRVTFHIDEKDDLPQKEKDTRPTLLSTILRHTKVGVLLLGWLFFTVVFMLYNEKEVVRRYTAVLPGEVKEHYINVSLSPPQIGLYIELYGPLYTDSEQELKLTNESDILTVWFEMYPTTQGSEGRSKNWSVMVLDADSDFDPSVKRKQTLRIPKPDVEQSEGQILLKMLSNVNKTIPLSLAYTPNPITDTVGLTCSLLLLVALYGLIIFEVINRTLAAVLVSTLSLGVLAVLGERPTLPELISWLDVETLLLLFSMMLLVAITAETGLFDFVAVFAFSVTKGKLWPLINLLCFFTAILSTFLDNVTTVLLMSPVTIRLCEVMELNPVPVLMAMVIYSNIGGTATPVGDPPNVIIASNADVIEHGINFANFTLHMTAGIVFVSLQTYFQMRYIYRDVSKLRLRVPKDIQELRQQINVWRRASGSLPTATRDENIVRTALDKKVAKLERRLSEMSKERKKRAVPAETFQSMLASLRDKYKIRNKELLVKSAIAIGFVVMVFFLHSIPELKRISLGWTALMGAILLLVLAQRDDLEHVLGRVEWATLLFFASLFVLMEALTKLGLIDYIGGLTVSVINQVDEGARLTVSVVLILWVSGLASAFVDNIPLTTMMVRIATSLGNNHSLGLPMAPLIWALSFGACLGGNGTLIGASANVVTAGVAEQHGYKFTFTEFFKIGFPLMLGQLTVATAYLLFCHCLLEWH